MPTRDWQMVWDGKIHPYARTTQRQKWVDPRYKKYQAWKEEFRLSANVANLPSELDKSKRYSLMLSIHLKGSVVSDADNNLKAVLDSLFAQDRYVTAVACTVVENQDRDWVLVTLSERAK